MTRQEYNNCIDLYADRLYRFLLKMGKDRENARDIVQDAFEALWRNRKKVEPEKARQYLFSCGHNRMIDIHRKNGREVALNGHDAVAGHKTEYTGVMEMLEKGLEKLPGTQKEVLVLRDYEGYDYNEIGRITGLSASQVKVYLHRARKSLKEFILKMENYGT